MVQYSEILTTEDYNRKSYMAYQMATTAVTLNDLEGCRPLEMQFVEHLCSILDDFN